MPSDAIQFENVSKEFFGIRALSGITLSMPPAQIIGIVGENGAGKSTLMNILGGIVTPDTGSMTCQGQPHKPAGPADATRAGIAFIHQELNLFGNLSIVDNLFIDGFPKIDRLGLLDKRKANQSAHQALQTVGLHCPVHTLVENLTPCEQQLVEIARAVGRNARLIILDEPTSSLTQNERDRLFSLMNTLRNAGCTLVFISHNLDEVLRMSDRIVVLRDGCLVSTGSKTEYTVERMIIDMVGRQIKNLYPPKTSVPSETILLEVSGVTRPGIIEDISFALHKGEILGLFGLMGSGRTELARILFGLDPCTAGEIVAINRPLRRHKPAESIHSGLAFVTENRRDEGLLMEASIEFNIALAALRQTAGSRSSIWVDHKAIRDKSLRVARDLRLQAADHKRQSARNLSGGNQQKLVIAKWLLTNPQILILDEPTRGIDVGAKYEIYTIMNNLAAGGAGILCISSELEELTATCDRILVMSNGRIHGDFARSEFNEKNMLHAAFKGLRTAAEPGDR
ncbi:MAG: sugar ABC transporter ATP-binding protein [Phycisphaerae bacterium]|nr:sugar ABC transporter ATP-binding protein [Phycisphaerae bacterium]